MNTRTNNVLSFPEPPATLEEARLAIEDHAFSEQLGQGTGQVYTVFTSCGCQKSKWYALMRQREWERGR